MAYRGTHSSAFTSSHKHIAHTHAYLPIAGAGAKVKKKKKSKKVINPSNLKKAVRKATSRTSGLSTGLDLLQAAVAAPADAKLPPGWKAHTHEGRTYYANKASGETSWTLPSASIAETAPPAMAALPSGWAEHVHEGRAYYVNTANGETVWERPTGAAVVATVTAAAPAPTGTASASGTAVSLPPGWKAHSHVESDRTYYHHAESDRTSWTVPTSGGDAALSGRATPAEGALPDGWAEHTHDASGRSYYVHAVSGATKWELEEGLQSSSSGVSSATTQAGAVAATATATAVLPLGWSVHSHEVRACDVV